MIYKILEQAAREMGLMLSEEHLRSFELFAAELKKWNSRVNLTAITRDNEIAIKHFIDSLQLTSYVHDHDHLLDIGSGAGFPLIPLKIVKPETVMISVDAVAKKVNFQRHIIRILKLQRIEALHTRVEELQKSHAHTFSLIVSRAFTRLDQFVLLAAPLLAEKGRLIAMKGAGAEDEISASNQKLKVLGFAVTAVHPYRLPENMGERCLTVIMPRQSL